MLNIPLRLYVDAVQDELHIIEECSLLSGLREQYADTISFVIKDFFFCDHAAIAAYIFQALEIIYQ